MIRFGFEPIELIQNPNMTIALIGYCPAHASEWGDDVLLYFPAHKYATTPDGSVTFTPDEIEQIGLVYRDLL